MKKHIVMQAQHGEGKAAADINLAHLAKVERDLGARVVGLHVISFSQ